jgi:lauroyl/myristoyl acyltransferase
MSQLSVRYYPYRALGALAPHVPAGLGYRLSAQVGTLAYYLNPRGAAALRSNLYHVLGGKADNRGIKSTALEVFRNLTKNYYDLFHKHTMSEEEATSTITVRNLHYLEEGLREGTGVIVATAHFGPFDALWQIGRSLNLTITAPAEHLEPESLFQYVCKLRDKEWIRFLPVDQPLLGLFRALRAGETVALAADRDITGSGILVDFFGAPARLPDGPVQLALRTGANLLTCFALRQPDNSAVLQIEPILQLERTGDLARDVLVNVPKVAARMEQWIGRNPEQWLVLYPIWEDGRNAA